MARPPQVDGGRPHTVPIRLSDVEVTNLDKIRGSLSRSEWFRMVLGKAAIAQIEVRGRTNRRK